MSDLTNSFLNRHLSGVRLGTSLRAASLLLLATVSVGALILSYGMARVRIGGPIHTDMVQARNLLIEAAPPSLYLIEPVAEILEFDSMRRPAEVTQQIQQIRSLRRDFDARIRYWTESTLPEDLRAAVQALANGAAADLWAEIETTYLPLVEPRPGLDIEAARLQTQDARHASERRIEELFAEHRKEALALDGKVQSVLSEAVILAENETYKYKVASWVIVAVSLTLLLAMMRAGSVVVAGPIQALTDATNRLAARDYDAHIPFMGWQNEMGQLATSLTTLRDAARNAQSLEADAIERNRLALAEAEKLAEEQATAAAAFSQTLGRFLDGDLTARVEADVSGAYAAIKRDLNAGLERVRVLLAGVRAGVGDILGSSAEIATAAEDLSRRTETQAANLEETAAAVEQITATVRAA
ncbi:HAMP domain-containing protein, partial [Rubellimicrobium aerolatum]